MPELPEVETTLRKIKPFILEKQISRVIIRQNKLRFVIQPDLATKLTTKKIIGISRRGKYLIFSFKSGAMIIHLGMSGKLLLLPENHMPMKHEHVTFVFKNGLALCYIDQRKFGAILWVDDNPLTHPLLKSLGPEPFSQEFSAKYLLAQAKKRKTSVKQFIMDSHTVTGVGNIYAAEALFLAKIHPEKKINTVTQAEFAKLITAIKTVLRLGIKKGGATIKDFAFLNGSIGSFQNEMKVYGRENLPCLVCKTILKSKRLGQRSTVYCPRCQKN